MDARKIIKKKYIAIKRIGQVLDLKQEWDIVGVNDGLTYIGGVDDYDGIMGYMIRYKENFAKKQIDMFANLCKRYYKDIWQSNGLFLDIGANIGTTFIYFKKIHKKEIQILAFEPESNNYKCACINTILNDVDNDTVLEKIGVGSKEDTLCLFKRENNFGGNSFIDFTSDNYEMVKTISLDGYCKKKGIPYQNIKYLWIDTEGYEPYVLFGAKEILSSCKIPVFMEFNPQTYSKVEGLYDEMIAFIQEHWTGYIDVLSACKGAIEVKDIYSLNQYRDYGKQYGDIFLV